MNYFKRLKTAACEVADAAQAYVSARAELFRIRQQLNLANEQLEVTFAELGRLTYQGSAALAGVRSREEINADIEGLLQTIEILEEEQAAILEEMKKEAPAEEESKTCEDVPSSFCHKCGTAQTTDSDYCRKCGIKLVK